MSAVVACHDCGHQWTPGTTKPPTKLSTVTTTGQSVADQLRDNWNWHVELAARGWTLDRTASNGDSYWVRPGKQTRHGHSAVLHPDGPLVIFTTEISSAFRQLGAPTSDGSGYAFSPFDFYAAADHNGDRSAAARAHTTPNTPHNAPQATNPNPGTADPLEDPDELLRNMLVDWGDFWLRDHGDAEWIAEPVIPAKRSVALFAPGGTGKSLLSLWLAASIATGKPTFGTPTTPKSVLYLDYEMTADDLAERLENMGYGADTNLTNLHYALLPSLPGLDQPEGGKAVVRLAQLVQAELVIIDTFGRAVHGDENEADTVRAWYRWTGIHLKHDGRAFVRVDHAGKDIEKGQRGTSAKNDDVDIVWQMTAGDAGTFKLKAKKRRMGWVPLEVDLTMTEDDHLRFTLTDGHTYPAGTKDAAKQLDTLGIHPTTSVNHALKALRDAGHGIRKQVVSAAQRYRRDLWINVELEPQSGSRPSGTTPTQKVVPEPWEPLDAETVNPLLEGGSRDLGTTGNHPPSVVVPGSPPKGGNRYHASPDDEGDEYF
jgi:hypothetical protein